MSRSLEHVDIRRLLEQRSPFLLVDRILEVGEERAVGLKNVTGTEPFLVGHFPDDPVMPGVLLIESMSQVGGVFLVAGGHVRPQRRGLLAAVDKARFRVPVRPGDQLVMEATLIVALGDVARVRVQGFVDRVEVCSAEVSYGFNENDTERHRRPEVEGRP